MNKAQLWQDIIKEHPGWANNGAHLSPKRTKTFFYLACAEAEEYRLFFGWGEKKAANRVRRTLGM